MWSAHRGSRVADLCRIVVTSHAVLDAGPAHVRIDRPPARWPAEERGILDDSERSNRLQNIYSVRDNRELASSYDEWAEDYEDDMLSLGYAIPAVAAGFVGRHVPVRGTVLDAGAGTGLFGSILRVLGYEDLVGIDISERMLEKAGEKHPERSCGRERHPSHGFGLRRNRPGLRPAWHAVPYSSIKAARNSPNADQVDTPLIQLIVK